jgi:hypothetical protein
MLGLSNTIPFGGYLATFSPDSKYDTNQPACWLLSLRGSSLVIQSYQTDQVTIFIKSINKTCARLRALRFQTRTPHSKFLAS